MIQQKLRKKLKNVKNNQDKFITESSNITEKDLNKKTSLDKDSNLYKLVELFENDLKKLEVNYRLNRNVFEIPVGFLGRNLEAQAFANWIKRVSSRLNLKYSRSFLGDMRNELRRMDIYNTDENIYGEIRIFKGDESKNDLFKTLHFYILVKDQETIKITESNFNRLFKDEEELDPVIQKLVEEISKVRNDSPKLIDDTYQNESVLSPNKIKKTKLDKNTIEYYYNFNLDPENNVSFVLVVSLTSAEKPNVYYHKDDVNLKKPLHLYPYEWGYFSLLKTPDGKLEFINDVVKDFGDKEIVDNYLSKDNKRIIAKKLEELANLVVKKEKPDIIIRSLDSEKINMKRYINIKEIFEQNGYSTFKNEVNFEYPDGSSGSKISWIHVKNKYKNYVTIKEIGKITVPEGFATRITPKEENKYKRIIRKLFE